AADALKKAEASNSAEAFGGGAPEKGSALARQAEANKTLLTAIAQAGVAGTNARQQSEANYLTNLRTIGQQESAAGTTQIASEYGRRKSKIGEEEAQVRTTKPGRVGKLYGHEQAEQAKLRSAMEIAAGKKLEFEQGLIAKKQEGAANRAAKR